MTAASVIAARCLPGDARVDQRVPKKLLVVNGAPAADKHKVHEGADEVRWVAALNCATIGVPIFRDDTGEHLEIAVLTLTLRAGAKAPRLTELIHRATPYPVFLIQSQPGGIALSLAHLRWSEGQSGQTMLDGPVITTTVDAATPTTDTFPPSLAVTNQPRKYVHAFYQGWMERFEARAEKEKELNRRGELNTEVERLEASFAKTLAAF